MASEDKNIAQLLIDKGFSVESLPSGDMENIRIIPENLLTIAEFLKLNMNFNLLFSVTGVDIKENFIAAYHLYSTKTNESVILKAWLDRNNPEIESLCSIYSAANWHEREVYDLLGIKFKNHPDLRRILLPDDWEGYPLRKDYTMNDKRLVWNER